MKVPSGGKYSGSDSHKCMTFRPRAGKEDQLKRIFYSFSLVIVVCFSSLLLGGCGSPRVSNLTSQLDAATEGSAQKTKVFLQKLNEIHRQIFLDGQKVDDTSPGDTPAPPNSTTLSTDDLAAIAQLLKDAPGVIPSSGQMPYYSIEAVQARTCYASTIETYGTQVNLIVNSKTSSEAQKRLGELRSQLEQLGSQVASTKLPSAQQVGTRLQELSGPVIDLGRIGANALLAYIRDKWTNETVNANEQIYSQMCVALSDDLNLGAERAKTRTTRMITVYKRYFAKKKRENTYTEPDRRSYEAELEKLTKYLQDIDNDNPAQIYLRAKSLHDKLAGLVKSKKR